MVGTKSLVHSRPAGPTLLPFHRLTLLMHVSHIAYACESKTKPCEWVVLVDEIASLDLSQILHSSQIQFRDLIIKIYSLLSIT